MKRTCKPSLLSHPITALSAGIAGLFNKGSGVGEVLVGPSGIVSTFADNARWVLPLE
jgi:hypothetical protein